MSCFSNNHQWNPKKTLPFIKRRDFLCNHSDGDLFTVITKCEDITFSREMYYNKIDFQTTFPASCSRFTRNEIDRRSSPTLLQQFYCWWIIQSIHLAGRIDYGDCASGCEAGIGSQSRSPVSVTTHVSVLYIQYTWIPATPIPAIARIVKCLWKNSSTSVKHPWKRKWKLINHKSLD